MQTRRFRFGILAFALPLPLVLVSAARAAAAPPLPAFSAQYAVMRHGSQIGAATLTLAAADQDRWTFTTVSHGTAGLASLLGASTREVSTFRWVGRLPQALSYEYSLATALKDRQRSMHFDWTDGRVTVADKGTHRYTAPAGAVERHSVTLALAAALTPGATQLTLAVATRDHIDLQHFAIKARQTIAVPAGQFDAVRVVRTDGDGGNQAWFAPDATPAPIKIEQGGEGGFSLLLQSWSPQP